MDWGSSSHIVHLIATYGLLAIAVIIALESMGLPLPGESVLALAAAVQRLHPIGLPGGEPRTQGR